MHDPCYHPTFENCQKSSKHPDGFECCSEIPPKGKATFGLWVKKGTCDKKRGQCNTKNPNDSLIIVEQIDTISSENFKDFSYLKILLIFLIICLIVFLMIQFKRFRRSRNEFSPRF